MKAPTVKKGWNSQKNEPIESSFVWSDIDIDLLEEDFGKRNFLIRHINRWRARRMNRKLYERYYPI